MNYKICFITCIFNNFKPIDIPCNFEKNSKYKYYLFTNFDKTIFNTNWEIITIKNLKFKNNIVTSRYFKFMGWEYIETVLKEHYDCYFYCDAYLYPNITVDWQTMAHYILHTNHINIMQEYHPDINSTINDELNRILYCKKDSEKNIAKTKSFFAKKFNINLNVKQTMYRNTVFGYSTTDNVKKHMLDFWKEYQQCPTYRDQPLWAIFYIKNSYTPILYPLFKSFNCFPKSKHDINAYDQ